MAIFGQKPKPKPLGKCEFFHFFNFFFDNLERRFFVLEYRKRRLAGLYSLKKQRWKNSNFWTKTMAILEKCQFFDLFNFLVLQPKKAFFGFRIQQKIVFWPILPKKKKLEKWPLLDQNHRLTPLQQCQFFDLFKFLFLEPRKSFFRFRIWLKTLGWPILPEKTKLEKWPILDQNHRLTPLEKCHFFYFLNFRFLQPRKSFFSSRIS